MAFLAPLFLFLGLLAAPIILMYMLRLRRREMLVSSTLLWQKLLRDREANAPWQKLRRNLLLILQLLILAALVLALARPFLPVPSVVSGSVVLLLDGSASMLATDVSPDRFTVAREEASRLIGDLGGGYQMTLILVGQTPRVLLAASSDKTELRRALAAAEAETAVADWPAAFALAAGAAQGFRDARIVIISDGGLPPDLPPLPTQPVYLPVGRSGENLALAALATRNTETAVQLFASVANYGIVERETLLSISLDGVLYDARRLRVPAQGSASTTWELTALPGIVEAHLSELQEDYLTVDNRAWVVHEGGVSNRVLLITAGNLFLEQVYAVLPGVTAFKAPPGTAVDEEFDLYVLDGAPLPDPLPAASLLIINPVAPESPASAAGALFTVTGIFSNTVAVRLADSPLLDYVDWFGRVNIRQAKNVSAPWAQPLVQAEGGPLILSGERSGQRIIIVTFDLRDSDLPLQIAFPILMANITEWLNPGRAFASSAALLPGEPVRLRPTTSATAVAVQKPNGELWRMLVAEDELIFNETTTLGVYNVLLREGSGDRAAGSFAVNLFSPDESAIAPQTAVRVGQMVVETAVAGDVGQREFWPWLAALAVAILVIEWWVHHRGTQLPGIRKQR